MGRAGEKRVALVEQEAGTKPSGRLVKQPKVGTEREKPGVKERGPDLF